MTQVAQFPHRGLEHLLLAAVFGRTARGRNASSPPCPDHHTRDRKKKQEQPDLHRLSIAQSGTGRCVKSARRINRHRPTIGGRGYRAISSALAACWQRWEISMGQGGSIRTSPPVRTRRRSPAVTLPDRSVPHQRHQHACRGGRGREHDSDCESAQVRPVAPPVGRLRQTRRAVMHSMRGGVEAGRQGHGMHFSRCAITHHSVGMCVNQLSDLTGPDSVRDWFGRW